MISFGFFITNPFSKYKSSVVDHTICKDGNIISNIFWEFEIYKSDVLVSFNFSVFCVRYPKGHNHINMELGLFGYYTKFTIYTGGYFDGCV